MNQSIPPITKFPQRTQNKIALLQFIKIRSILISIRKQKRAKVLQNGRPGKINRYKTCFL